MEMIIQNETGNFTLHVRISDSKEYDFLKDVTELARKYDFENDDFEIEDPENETGGGQDLKEIDSKGENDE